MDRKESQRSRSLLKTPNQKVPLEKSFEGKKKTASFSQKMNIS
jgi:hypothetical protein